MEWTRLLANGTGANLFTKWVEISENMTHFERFIGGELKELPEGLVVYELPILDSIMGGCVVGNGALYLVFCEAIP
jgi:hypothetical protein